MNTNEYKDYNYNTSNSIRMDYRSFDPTCISLGPMINNRIVPLTYNGCAFEMTLPIVQWNTISMPLSMEYHMTKGNYVKGYLCPVLKIARNIGKYRRILKKTFQMEMEVETEWKSLGMKINSDLLENDSTDKFLLHGDYPTYIQQIIDDKEKVHELGTYYSSEDQRGFLDEMRKLERLYSARVKEYKTIKRKCKTGGEFAVYGSLDMVPFSYSCDMDDFEGILVYTKGGEYNRVVSVITGELNEGNPTALSMKESVMCGVKYPAYIVGLYH